MYFGSLQLPLFEVILVCPQGDSGREQSECTPAQGTQHHKCLGAGTGLGGLGVCPTETAVAPVVQVGLGLWSHFSILVCITFW